MAEINEQTQTEAPVVNQSNPHPEVPSESVTIAKPKSSFLKTAFIPIMAGVVGYAFTLTAIPNIEPLKEFYLNALQDEDIAAKVEMSPVVTSASAKGKANQESSNSL